MKVITTTLTTTGMMTIKNKISWDKFGIIMSDLKLKVTNIMIKIVTIFKYTLEIVLMLII